MVDSTGKEPRLTNPVLDGLKHMAIYFEDHGVESVLQETDASKWGSVDKRHVKEAKQAITWVFDVANYRIRKKWPD